MSRVSWIENSIVLIPVSVLAIYLLLLCTISAHANSEKGKHLSIVLKMMWFPEPVSSIWASMYPQVSLRELFLYVGTFKQ